MVVSLQFECQFLAYYLTHKNDRFIVTAEVPRGDLKHASRDIGSEWVHRHFCCNLVAEASHLAILDSERVETGTPPVGGKSYKVIFEKGMDIGWEIGSIFIIYPHRSSFKRGCAGVRCLPM